MLMPKRLEAPARGYSAVVMAATYATHVRMATSGRTNPPETLPPCFAGGSEESSHQALFEASRKVSLAFPKVF
jgi:hypothetical protein